MKALALTSAVFTVLLAVAAGILMLRPDPLGGEPFAQFVIDPGTRPESGNEIVMARESGTPAPAPATSPAADAGLPSVPGAPAEAQQPPEQSTVSLAAPNAAIGMGQIPDDSLIESSRYGPLPRIGGDGRRPSDTYARPTSYSATPQQGEPARIAILINGLGLSDQVTTDVVEKLPGEVTLAFSAYGRDLQGWARRARADGHEVMLQIPLEPFDYPDNDPGPQTLLTSLTPEENQARLHWLLARFSGYTGVTNHMGAKFAAAQDAFLPVLEELRSRGLTFVDDGTASRSTAGNIAKELGLGFTVAQVQLDKDKTGEAIDKSLEKLEKIASENGFAIGVGTALPITVERLAAWAAEAEKRGIVLIPVSAAVQARHPS